jgi:pimeloyl-ACP methyl ester carboxylesterase
MNAGYRRSLGTRVMSVLLALVVWLPSARSADEPKEEKGELAGVWQGTLDVKVAKLRLVLHVDKQEDGSLKASLDSPDQGANGIPIDEVTVKEGEVELSLKLVKASYAGRHSEDDRQIVGTWKQGAQDWPLTFDKLEKAPKYGRPQDPTPPLPYAEEEVSYENAEAGVSLAGTLTIPEGDGPFPAVLLISGSGPQDRNETLLGHRPFLVLADFLTRQGIAVLRSDDRGVGGSTGDFGGATSEDFATDALAAVAFLKTRSEIDPRRIGLVGHSEGGLVAPLAAARSSEVAFIVLMAGTGVTGEEILYRQGGLILKAAGASDEAIAEQRALQEKIFVVIKEEKIATAAQARLRELFDAALAAAAVEGAEVVEAQKAQVEAQLQMVLSPWFRFFLTHDPRPTLAKVRCPVLAINGEKDVQVDPRQNLPEIEKALHEGGNRLVTVREFAGLNHLFQTCQTGGLAEYSQIEETFAPAALACIADWVLNLELAEK